MTDWTGMGPTAPKPRRSANFGQDGPSAAKLAAARDRAMLDAARALACASCPYTGAECAWACRLGALRT